MLTTAYYLPWHVGQDRSHGRQFDRGPRATQYHSDRIRRHCGMGRLLHDAHHSCGTIHIQRTARSYGTVGLHSWHHCHQHAAHASTRGRIIATSKQPKATTWVASSNGVVPPPWKKYCQFFPTRLTDRYTIVWFVDTDQPFQVS
jgi:hypothetical protein